jgi:tRNA-dihydrouridine synthase B
VDTLIASPVILGGLRLANRLVSAPMAGVSDRTFRRLAREAGCALAFPEMVSDKALLFGNEKTTTLAAPYPGENPFVIQLLGRDPGTLARAARLVVERFAPHLVDINMGCPVPKVVRNGEGAALLREPSLCAAIIERVRAAVPANIPVSCKIRLGLDEPTALEVARGVASAGAAFITVHGRLRTQSYSWPADWAAIGEVASAISVPVVGNGDVLEPPDAGRMLRSTGCQAAMVGRGALGNPWLFARTLRLARTGGPGPAPTPRERVTMALRHLELAGQDKGERLAVLEMRHHGSWYIKGLPGAAVVRSRFMRTATVAALARVLEDYLEVLSLGPFPDTP